MSKDVCKELTKGPKDRSLEGRSSTKIEKAYSKVDEQKER